MDRALRATAGALAPNSLVRPPPRSLRTLRIPGYFRRTPDYYRLAHGRPRTRLLHAMRWDIAFKASS